MKKIILGALMLFLFGCAGLKTEKAPKQELTLMQVRQLYSREFQGSPEQVLKATIAVLQDNKYIIQKTESNVGFIYATKEVSFNEGKFTDTLVNTFIHKIGFSTKNSEEYKLTAIIEKTSSKTATVRFTAHEIDEHADDHGDRKTRAYQLGPETYKPYFDQIVVELERINARR